MRGDVKRWSYFSVSYMDVNERRKRPAIAAGMAYAMERKADVNVDAQTSKSRDGHCLDR